ncbi:DUF262 domain-containing protein [Aliivibrio fischeri]|uniref:DUF262 domain-containing protein n=1 Tax=Aliivibrio fischeri TaxID=668 RepID=UPI001F210843|nr:DUF262 domain-containing HNH endonuclease family protein [Aliivibrio fischeri]MCE7555401.1 DUF262 domain-containing HNH endonuclease family protein [Aliivibrio fischeri]MCE7562669.1 DUF262 domain-containing HNH endonuclease family protein [Aliivibrio fischeri]MCE7570077.1 DUF262 domain-containing HNH endonuclease family protein [Aliivibrio fischeri]
MSDLKNIFEATPDNILQLLTSKWAYYIPAYQREFNWDESKAIELVNNFCRGIKKLKNDTNSQSFTFLGAIISIDDKESILPKPENRNDLPSEIHHIIDGQQRLTTLIIIIKALDSLIKDEMTNVKNKLTENTHEPEVGELIQITKKTMNQFKTSLISKIEKRDCFFNDEPSYHEYPRIIRAYKDCWSQGQDEKYESEISSFIKGKKNENSHVLKIYNQIKPEIKKRISEIEREIFTQLSNNTINKIFGTTGEEIEFKSNIIQDNFGKLLSLLFLSQYILNKVCVTYVTVKNNMNAFDIFEALNTTGDPLTAFETFKPQVIENIGLDKYDSSENKKIIDELQVYFDTVNKRSKSKITKQTTSWLALCYDKKISDDISEHRDFLKVKFNELNIEERNLFLKKYHSIALHHKYFILDNKKINSELLNKSQCELVKVLLYFIKQCGFELITPILSNLSDHLDNEVIAEDEYIDSIKAITAFSFLYRSAHKDSSGIDNAFRKIIFETYNNHTNLKETLINILYEKFKAEAHTLKSMFIEKSIQLDHYALKSVTKFIILCSIHNAQKNDELGILIDGVENCYNAFTLSNFNLLNSIEHIAPTDQQKWDTIKDSENLNKIGNLTLLPSKTNTSISNKSWDEKQALYSILSQTSQDKKNTLIKIYKEQYSRNPTQIDLEVFQPQVSSLCSSNEIWTDSVIKKRTINTYERAYDLLIKWLH